MAQSSLAQRDGRHLRVVIGFSGSVAVIDEFSEGLLDDDAFGICVGGCAVQAVLVQVEHDDLRVLVLVEAVSVRDLLGHIVLVPTRLLDHVSEHLVDGVGLRGFFGLDLFEQSFDLSVLLLVLSEQFL